MTEHSFRRTTCRLCGGPELELVMHLAPTPPADDYVPADRLGETQANYPLDLFFCHGCCHVQLLDVVDPSILYRDYIYVTSSSPGLEAHFSSYADDVMDRVHPPRASLVVDIGSNDGTLLRFFKNHGMRVLGVDPAQEIARRATESGIKTIPAFHNWELAHRISSEYGRATVITANNVIANVDALQELIESIRILLAPDGVFVFETGYLLDLVRNSVFDNIYHEHLSYHSVIPFADFFKRCGMELIHVQRVPTKGGSLRGTVQLSGGPRKQSASVADSVSLEQNNGLDRIETYKAFAARIDEVKHQLLGLLRRMKADGKSIAGYGASHSVTTVLHHFDLNGLVSFLVDDNPRKQNTFSPGHHIPVLPPAAIYERKPDYIVILPWRFSDLILTKHQAYLDGGGHFVVPLPKVKVI